MEGRMKSRPKIGTAKFVSDDVATSDGITLATAEISNAIA
jgi:hypothetical protein